jgi:hypothetical protein
MAMPQVRKTRKSSDLGRHFPQEGRLLLSGTGADVVSRLGVDAVRSVVLSVLMGENVRTQTEPLTRQRLVQLSGALITMFNRGFVEDTDFGSSVAAVAADVLSNSRSYQDADRVLAMWCLGLTGKAIQNVLRNDSSKIASYVLGFEQAIEQAAQKCQEDYGDVALSLGVNSKRNLSWADIARITTAIGSQTLSIRGSDKSIYGKLFEPLILGSALTALDFSFVRIGENEKSSGVFWLSDSSDTRECDATVLIRPGTLVRFDIGFIGPGNSEISKDKLTRYAREVERDGRRHSSVTFIVVDRLPETSRTQQLAADIGAEIVQMSMQYWPRELARRLARRVEFTHPIQIMDDGKVAQYLSQRVAEMPILEFVSRVEIAPSDDE